MAATRLGPRKAALRLFQENAYVFRRLFAQEALKEQAGR